MVAQIFIPTAELVIPTGTQTNEANAGIETQQVTVETKISKCSTHVFLYLSLIKSLCLFLQKDNFLPHHFS